jgi:DNA-binding PadR family transcriptional regulator
MARKPRLGPASDPELLILSSLASGPKHGYLIMTDVEEFAGVKLGPGTLYTAITRLVERKLIAPQPGDDTRQRPYRLTSGGETVLADQLNAMRRIAALGMKRLRLA